MPVSEAMVERKAEPIQDRLTDIMTWLREPDWIEQASLEWLTDWINRRPIAQLAMVVMLMPSETAALSDPDVAVPDGWLLVPREPTETQLNAGALAWSGHRCKGASVAERDSDTCWQSNEKCRCRIAYEGAGPGYRAMIATAPPIPPANAAEGGGE